MNLDRALVLLLASVNAVAGFAPSAPHASTRIAQFVPQQIRPASLLFSEVEEAAEAPVAEAPVAEAPVVEEPAAEPAFDTSIYIGNLSFGEFLHFKLDVHSIHDQ